MSASIDKIKEIRISRKDSARAARVVGQFLAIRACLKAAESDSDEIDDIDEVAAQLTVAAFKPVKGA